MSSTQTEVIPFVVSIKQGKQRTLLQSVLVWKRL